MHNNETLNENGNIDYKMTRIELCFKSVGILGWIISDIKQEDMKHLFGITWCMGYLR